MALVVVLGRLTSGHLGLALVVLEDGESLRPACVPEVELEAGGQVVAVDCVKAG